MDCWQFVWMEKKAPKTAPADRHTPKCQGVVKSPLGNILFIRNSLKGGRERVIFCGQKHPIGPPKSVTAAERLRKDESGSTLVEAAIVLPMIIVLLIGAISYGIWFMAAHSVQQAANEGARAALGALDQAERSAIVEGVVSDGVLSSGTVNPEHVQVSTDLDDNLFTVTVTYDSTHSALLANSLVPMPESPIRRTASVRLNSF